MTDSLNTPFLPNLPIEVKQLIHDGIYSLYEISSGHESAKYVLITDDRAYFLIDGDGDVIEQKNDINSIVLKRAIRSTVATSSNNSLKLNYA